MLNKLIIFVFVLITTTACTTDVWNVQAIKYTDQSFTPKPDNYNIDTLFGEAKKPHIVIAHISVNQKGFHMLSFEAKDSGSAIRALKKRARELGADAIMNFKVHVGASGTVGSGTASAQGVAIKWK